MTLEEQAQTLSKDGVVSLLIEYRQQQEELSNKTRRINELEEQLRWFKQQLFGQKSEQRKYIEPDARQLSLGEIDQQVEQKEVSAVAVSGYQRGKAKKQELEGTPEDSGLRFGPEVPVREIEVPNPEIEGLKPEEYQVIEELHTYRLAQEPASYVVLKYVRKKVKLNTAEQPSWPAAPPAVIKKSYADVSLLAGMTIDKCLYHLPIYRQHQRLTRSGIIISRSMMTQLLHRVGEMLEAVYEANLRSILEGTSVIIDETPLKAGRAKPGKMKTTYFWPIYGMRNEVCFPWFESRAHANVEVLLKGYSGIIVSDGYEAYENYARKSQEVERAQCWNHARREFVKALKAEPVLAKEALDYIGELYQHEEQIKTLGLTEERKLRYRLDHSKPVVEKFFDWLEQTFADHVLLPTTRFTKAANYVLDRKEALQVFLRFPEVPIDTNEDEREIRCIAVGRKNWNFCWTEIGAKYLGIFQSLIRTCLLQDVNPWQYLVDVLQRLQQDPPPPVDLLIPRLWKEHFASQRIRSPLEILRTPAS